MMSIVKLNRDSSNDMSTSPPSEAVTSPTTPSRERPAPPPIYDSARRPPPYLEEFALAWAYRHLLVEFVRRDIKSRYKRSVLGVAWTLLNPLLMMLVLTFVFSNLFRVNVEHYAVYVLSGTVLWNLFAQSSTSGMLQLVWGGSLLNRIYLPRTIFALSAVATGLTNALLALIPLLLIMVITGAPFRPTLLALPLPIALTALFALGVGLLMSTLAVSFPDVAEMFQIALSAWYFATPIIYPLTILPESARSLVQWNPMCPLVELFRWSVYRGAFSWTTLGQAVGLSLATFFLGWLTFSLRADKVSYKV